MTQTIETEPASHASGRPVVLTLIALLVLTLISWGISNFALGWASMVVALAIAALKAGLVVYWLMELPLAATPARIIIIVTISFIALLCAGTVADVSFR
jgi:cytochrome c oxidase subunit 4